MIFFPLCIEMGKKREEKESMFLDVKNEISRQVAFLKLIV